jgi:hypothetical protein
MWKPSPTAWMRIVATQSAPAAQSPGAVASMEA